MDAIVLSTSVVALLGIQHKLMVDEDDPETGDFPFLESLYRDVSHIVTKSPFQQGLSTRHALKHCERTQQRLKNVLDSLGFKNLKHSSSVLNRIIYTVKLNFKRQDLQKAKADYYNAVILLRDIAME
jgi:hypothetical protein